MPYIFYDLETSSINPVGQILNACFTLVDSQLEPKDCYKGSIHISRLQLPEVGAVLANRIDILEHQSKSYPSEVEFFSGLEQFIKKIQAKNGDITLVGYNSNSFDLGYLRTSLLRNGFYPYINKGNQDILLAIRSLYHSSEEFREFAEENLKTSEGKLQFTLQNIARSLDLLDGDQLHESSADVELTIEVAKSLRDIFEFDLNRFVSNQLQKYSSASVGKTVEAIILSRHNSGEQDELTLVNSDATGSRSLWISRNALLGGAAPRESIKYLKREDLVIVSSETKPSSEALEALKSVSDITVNNFFGPVACDVEQHIYAVSPQEIKVLLPKFHNPTSLSDLSKAGKELVLRYRLANYKMLEGDNSAFLAKFKEYANFRYGSVDSGVKMRLDKGAESPIYHESLDIMVLACEKKLGEVESEKDKSLISSLLSYYKSSELYKVLTS